MIKISIIVSVYNEEKVLNAFYQKLNSVISKIDNYIFEILFVNDGSIDNSEDILIELSTNDSNIKVINFSKNFGHEAAMIAGIDKASGDFIICMDSDLQHPPKEIINILQKAQDGYNIINMVRISNKKEKLWKRFSSKLFYKLINIISDIKFEPNASDFFMISKEVADIFRNNYREKIRFLRGYIQMVGFKKTTIKFHTEERFAGDSKYSMLSLIKFAIGIIFTFSNLPLRLGLYASFISFLIGIIIVISTIYMKLNGTYSPDGYTTIVVLLSFFFSILFLIIGIIGEYLRMIFEESKERPIYIIKENNDKY
ncbi:Glycosyltransferase [hydrothermal vent metagenome]|uniref:Glycosyltransferase n=1 Tax=hydrothermal vent metagenome TaxID=652676 RepID=A0A1W1EII1_9ZZZZ